MAYSNVNTKAIAIKHLLDPDHSQQDISLLYRLHCTLQVSASYACLKSVYRWHTIHHIRWMQNIWQQLICYSQIHSNEPHYKSAYEATFQRIVLYIILHVLGNTDTKICNQVTNQWPSQSKRSQLHPAGCVPGRCKLPNPQGRHPAGQGQHSQSHMQVGTGDLAEKKIF